jgi:hypothetical protein
MRCCWNRLASIALVATLVGAISPAGAATLEWNGTFTIEFGIVDPVVSTGTGVATLNGSGGTGHLDTLGVAGGITGSTTIPLTDPDNASLVTLVVTARLGTGSLSGVSGAPPLTGTPTIPVPGLAKLCLVLANCVSTIPIPLTVNGSVGVGIGGQVTVNGFATTPNAVKISLLGAPWTLGTASVTAIPTDNGGTSTATAMGFVHGPASGTSNTATGSGVIQVATPVRVVTSLNPPNNVLAIIGIVKLKMVPEPGLMLLLGSGIAGLVLLGRDRLGR